MPHPEPDSPQARAAWRDAVAGSRRARARRCSEPAVSAPDADAEQTAATLALTYDGRAVFAVDDSLDVGDVLDALEQAIEEIRQDMEAGRHG